VKRLRSECPDFDQMSYRGQAFAIATFLRMHNLTGLDSESAYRDLQNNYIGIALQDTHHPSLPLISAAIFCGLACRLGLDARCCGMLNHVHAMVFPDSKQERNNANADDSDPMYLDPYRSDQEIPAFHLLEMLSSWGIEPANFSRFIGDSSTASLVLRTSRNILATVHEFRELGANPNGHPTIRLYANPFADMDNAFYSALWANYMLTEVVSGPHPYSQRQFIPLILERFERLYPMDASLIEQYICPLYNNPSNAEHWELHEALRVVRAADQSPKQLKPRSTRAPHENVRYKVGQIFRHKRYSYTAVITGWDIECGMNSDWMAHNLVDSLSKGRFQSFYHSL
jgi:F-box protein 21